jgi:hypothetical protein
MATRDFFHPEDPSNRTMSFDEMVNTKNGGPDSGAVIALVGPALWGERWQSEMARALGVNKDTVQDWRQGRSEPKPGVWFDLKDIVEQRRDLFNMAFNAVRAKIPSKF